MGRKTKQAKNLGAWPVWAGSTTYQNADLARTSAGSALAYQTVIAVRRAVDLIGNALNGMGWVILRNAGYDRSDDEVVASSEDVRPRHPLQWAFQHHRRHFNTPILRAIASDYQLYGEVYCHKLQSPIKDGLRIIRRLNPLGVMPYEINGTIDHYSYSWDGQSMSLLQPDEVAYWHSFHPARDLRGLGVPTSAMDIINIKRNLQRFLRAFFANFARPDMVISPSGDDAWTPQDQARMLDVLRGNHKGTDNAFSAMVVHRAIEVLQLDPPDVTAQYSIDESITRQVFMAFGVPLAMAGDSSASSYKDGDEVMYGFFKTTILPFAADVQEYINYQIMPFFDPTGETRFEFDVSPYQRITETDLARAQLAETLYRSGVATLNEARKQVGLGALPDAAAPMMHDAPQDDAPQDAETFSGAPQPDKAARYDDIDFHPTDGMIEEAKRGLAWRQEYGRGGTMVGVARARDIIHRRALSPDTVRRMKAYFDRHQSDAQAEGWRPGEGGYPSAGRIAWALWGGDPGYAWARARVQQMDAADADNRKGACACQHPASAADDHAHHDRAPSWDRSAALHELKVWARRVKDGKTKPFTPRYLDGHWGWALQDAQSKGCFFDVYRAAKAFLQPNRLEAIQEDWIKSLTALEADFRRAWALEMERADNRELSRAQASTTLARHLEDYCGRAYVEGMRNGGYVVDDVLSLPDDARNELARHLEGQASYLSDLLAHIYLDDDLSAAQLEDKARLWWTGSVRPCYDMGLARAQRERPVGFIGLIARNQRYKWTLGDAEHCPSCLDLAGQVHTLDAYQQAGFTPGSTNLICKRFCKCRLEPTQEAEQGDLTSVRRG